MTGHTSHHTQSETEKNLFLHQNETRSQEDYWVAQHRLQVPQHPPSHMGVKIFNCLPPDINSMVDQKKIKYSFKKLLTIKAFYDFHE